MLADKITGAFDENTSQRIMSGNFYEFFKRFFERYREVSRGIES
jgi:hypothetical protein